MSVRVRFAPSPTGGLHIGGIRTALYNYLFAKKNGGTFILRIEDTDQNRFVEGAEEYIIEALNWFGISPDEGPVQGGDYGPYRQSERKSVYAQYAEQLIADGNAYYAFDTSEELEAMKARLSEARVVNPNYNAITRSQMKNSLTLSAEEVQQRLDSGAPYVIRFKMPKHDDVRFKDAVREWVVFNTSTLDDKVLMKSDGMPTYHLANIVDDHLMEITHVIRGEEWLPSAPLHVLLYESLGWKAPVFAHLPLLLKPDGNGKLSKRAADKMGFPIFPLNWTDPKAKESSVGFRESGYFADAFLNFLAFLGWNPGTEQEIFSLEELVAEFSLERINKAGAKFDIEKAKWFNQQYLKAKDVKQLAALFTADLKQELSNDKAEAIVNSLKERVTFVSEMAEAGGFFFERPASYDAKTVRKKWNEQSANGIAKFAEAIGQLDRINPEEAKALLVTTLESLELGLGQVMPALRVSLTGQAGGPDLMEIITILGPSEVAERIRIALDTIDQ
ncbi:MAG: glutamate--tRNA ligase [Roseivirga sp.]|nr:glutamate--tRNA ligase [Roseivirga sp.]